MLWAGSLGEIHRFNPSTGEFKTFEWTGSVLVANNAVGSLLKDREGILWAGAPGALMRYEPDTETFSIYSHDPGDPESLGYAYQPPRLAMDHEGTLWIGTWGGGLSVLRKDATNAEHYARGSGDLQYRRMPFGITGSRPFYQDPEGKLWIGVFGNGLHLIDRTSGRVDVFLPEPVNSPSLAARYGPSIILLLSRKYCGWAPGWEDSSDSIWSRASLRRFLSSAEYR